MSIDYSSLGLKVGLEIHRQLDSQSKLFCECPTLLSQAPPTLTFTRKLRPTQSELGQVDPAALFEFHKGRRITYEWDSDTACLVEADEEPPHPLNKNAVEAALTISLLLKARPLDEIHVMRKVVIDGSNTTGFQRTVVIGLAGKINVDGKEVPIEQVTLEEDAGRKISETKDTVTFRLDRLGVPLIEVSTGPVIKSPSESERTALAIGRILRATREVKRGLGSIRQDLNVSIKNGALVEIKGVQELELVSKVVELEAQRQQALIGIRDELRQRSVTPSGMTDDLIDVTAIFSSSQSKVIQAALKQGGKVYGVRLSGFKGLLKRELIPGIRLGTEMAKRAAFWGKVGGIFHSDELPAYGIGQTEIESISRKLDCTESDAFVLIADAQEHALDGLKAVVERAKEASERVPEETRTANPDGTTHYMRPRPGAARMYPETDVPPVAIDTARLQRISEHLPRMPEELALELESKYTLSNKLASQLVDSEFLPVFESIAAASKNVAPSYIATILTESLKSLAREKVPVDNLQEHHLQQVFGLVDRGTTAKESVADILKFLAVHAESTPEIAVKELNLEMLSRTDLEHVIQGVMGSQQATLAEQGSKAIDRIMGLVMREVRGRADPRIVNELLKAKLHKVAT
jgi:glutamyl-tRNA(Gln) amidotransferase subunit E